MKKTTQQIGSLCLGTWWTEAHLWVCASPAPTHSEPIDKSLCLPAFFGPQFPHL